MDQGPIVFAGRQRHYLFQPKPTANHIGHTITVSSSSKESGARATFIPRRHFPEWSTNMFKYLRLILAVPILLIAASCSTQQTASAPGTDPELEAKARAALQALVDDAPRTQQLQQMAKAILVFPDILKAGFIVGAQGGKGVMFGPDGKVLGYYTARAVSYGLQAGGQTFSEAMFLMTDSAVSYLNSSDGWSVGMGPSVVVVDAGMGKSMTTTTLKSDVYAFIFGQQGLMAGLGVQGQKISKYNP
ncbi:lipid-binding SYLF domain-containing protein [Paraburkholderia sediminicola]|uniref:lipid-binding SYLF domain-containing protein n=1 Tax=Paraburkholderia sediminicola TaxID=458836 RepID=UPI0038BDC071